VAALQSGARGAAAAGVEWGAKLVISFGDSESMVRRAAVSLLQEYLFPPHRHASTLLAGVWGGAGGGTPESVDVSASCPPAALCVAEILGETGTCLCLCVCVLKRGVEGRVRRREGGGRELELDEQE